MIGKIVCELAPSASNPRNSEGAFIRLRDERILYVYSRYGGGSHADGAPADLYGIVSDRDGESFGRPFSVFPRERIGAETVMSVSLLRMANGDIGLFFLKKNPVYQCRLHLSRSSDEGKTWSDPVPCIESAGYYCVLNDAVRRLSDGRLIAPASFCEVQITGGDGKIISSADCFLPASALFYCSDDDGSTWYRRGKGNCMPVTAHCATGLQEPCVVELSGGLLWCLMRTDLCRQYEMFSRDGGFSWTAPQPSAFTSAVSPIAVKRLSDGRLFAVWNPVPNYNGQRETARGVWLGGRTPLVAATSADDGRSFRVPSAIETDEDRGFCYTAVHELPDGGVLLAYCAGGAEDGANLNRVRIRKITAAEMNKI